MRKITLIILALFIAVSCYAQTLNLCSNTYTAHAPITMSNQSNITIRGDSINCGGGATVGINLTNCINVHIVRCKIINSTIQGILMNGCKNIEIDSCDIENVSDGIHHNQIAKPRGQKIQAPFYAHHNYFKNINGPFPLGNAIQLNNVGVAPGGGHVWMMYNSIECIDGQAQHPQDILSVFQSDGLPGDSILVEYNYIKGGQIIKDSGGAAGIVIGDVGGDFQVARYNVLVNPGAVGIQCQGGNGNTVDHNKIYGDGHGAISFEGLQYGNYSGASTSNVTESNNQINWKQPNGTQFNLWFDTGSGVSAPIGWLTNTPVNKIDLTINANILPVQLLQTCTVVITKPNINYSPGTYISTIGNGISIIPTNSGGLSSNWSVSPSLPASMSFNTTNGVITGSATVVTPATNYVITATNGGGSSSQTISIQTVNPVVNKPVINYSPNSITATVGTVITPLNPSNTGGAVVSWGISPTLPSGLLFANGTIAGIPLVSSTLTTYTVSATNSGGTGTAPVTIKVNAIPVVAPNITYPLSMVAYIQNHGITALLPTNTGGIPTGYTSDVALPQGLSLNPLTGAITGLPVAVYSPTAVTITAVNTGGSSHFTITFAVSPAAQSHFVIIDGKFGIIIY